MRVPRSPAAHQRRYPLRHPHRSPSMLRRELQCVARHGRQLRGVAQRSSKSIACLSIVVLREGFTGSAFRSVITGMMLALRPPFSSRVHASIDAGVQWLAGVRAQHEPLDVASLQQAAMRAPDCRHGFQHRGGDADDDQQYEAGAKRVPAGTAFFAREEMVRSRTQGFFAARFAHGGSIPSASRPWASRAGVSPARSTRRLESAASARRPFQDR